MEGRSLPHVLRMREGGRWNADVARPLVVRNEVGGVTFSFRLPSKTSEARRKPRGSL